jgi:hypothetical protein
VRVAFQRSTSGGSERPSWFHPTRGPPAPCRTTSLMLRPAQVATPLATEQSSGRKRDWALPRRSWAAAGAGKMTAIRPIHKRARGRRRLLLRLAAPLAGGSVFAGRANRRRTRQRLPDSAERGSPKAGDFARRDCCCFVEAGVRLIDRSGSFVAQRGGRSCWLRGCRRHARAYAGPRPPENRTALPRLVQRATSSGSIEALASMRGCRTNPSRSWCIN